MLLEEDARHNLFFKKKIPARTTQSLNWSYKKAQSARIKKEEGNEAEHSSHRETSGSWWLNSQEGNTTRRRRRRPYLDPFFRKLTTSRDSPNKRSASRCQMKSAPTRDGRAMAALLCRQEPAMARARAAEESGGPAHTSAAAIPKLSCP